MKKKIILGVLAIFLIVALVSCDDAGMDKLGEIMGGMSNNVYGIKPNMEDVQVVSSTITNSVKTNESGDVVINLESASSIIQQLSEIGTSTQKLSQAKADMATPLSNDKDQAEEIQKALKDSINDVITTNFNNEEIDNISNEKVKNVAKDVKFALETISNKIPSTPTQADLATVIIINSLSTQVINLKEVDKDDKDALISLVDTALAALDALKVSTEVSNIDVLGEFNITSLIPSSSNKESENKEQSEEEAKAVEEEKKDDAMQYVSQLQNSIINLIAQFSTKENGVYVFNQEKYDRFILQMTAIRTSYEIASYGLLPSIDNDFISDTLKNLGENPTTDIFGTALTTYIAGIKNKGDFNVEDLVFYLLSVAATEMEEIGTGIFQVEEELEEDQTEYANNDSIGIEKLYQEFLQANSENLQKSPIEKLDFSVFSTAYENKEELEVDFDVFNDVFVLARTVFAIVYESGADSIVSMFLPQGSTLEGFISEKIHELYDTLSKGE